MADIIRCIGIAVGNGTNLMNIRDVIGEGRIGLYALEAHIRRIFMTANRKVIL